MKKYCILMGVVMALCTGMVNTTGKEPSFADFDKKAKAGEKLTVAFLGGSLTWGAMASDPQKTSYRALLGRKLEETYPKANFKFVDAAIGGTGAQLGSFRLERDVLAYKPDLLFLDFTLNDGIYSTSPDTLSAQESIIRRLIGEAHCPVIQMFLATKAFVLEGNTDKMVRRKAHIAIAEAYNVPCGDALVMMQEKYKKGELDIDKTWPPDSFDNVHPYDPGYALYAEAGWAAYQNAVASKTVCKVPEKMLNNDTFMHLARVKVSSLSPMPEGWRVTQPNREYCAFDFLMSRWLDDVSVGSNFVAVDRTKTVPAKPSKALEFTFSGTSVSIFGEATERSCKYLYIIDGKEKKGDAKGFGLMWRTLAEGLDPAVEHTLEIHPVFESPDKPQELRIESICAAGGNPKVKLKHQ